MDWFKNLQKIGNERGRFTPAGRRLLAMAAVAAEPVDWYVRRRAAIRYNRQFPSTRITAADGFAVLTSAALPGSAGIVETCRRLYESKQAKLAAIPTGKRGKSTFLRNALDDQDLKANPILIEFALSDPLLSIVTNYLGVVPSLNRVDLLHSIARQNPEEHISSQVFHQDHEGLMQAKVFVNIFDVAEEHGPFTWLPAHQSEEVLAAIRRQRAKAGVPQHGHYRDEEVRANGGTSIHSLTGPPGSTVVVDTSRCLHAGSRVQPGHFRLCLYLQYCTTWEKANTFDASRFTHDPVRWLALKRHAAPA